MVIILFLLAAEFVWFYNVLQKKRDRETVDAIVVFGGDYTRTMMGYALANDGYAAHLIVSPASVEMLDRLDKSYRSNHRYQYLIEDQAETTFQNALLISDIVKKYDLNSLLLVTNDYHMPRSYFLLRLQLLGHGVSVVPYLVEAGRFEANPLKWSVTQKKCIYNEMVELWGSLIEKAHYSVSRRFPEMGLKRNRVVKALRSIFLFDL